jgi:transcriptional regulator with XRE-family HTH domain
MPLPPAGKADPKVLAGQIRSFRLKKKLTLNQLSELIGLDKGYLSRLERGEKVPSIATIVKLAHAFDTQVSTLLGESIDGAAIHIVREKARPIIESDPRSGDYRYSPLSRGGAQGKFEAFVMFPEPNFATEGHVAHGGDEIFFVLNGRVEVEFVDRTVGLAEGDYMQFPGHLLHRVRRLSTHAAVLIVVAGNP